MVVIDRYKFGAYRQRLMDQRLIWRPNAVPFEEWDKLSREQQIAWWRDRQDASIESLHPQRFVDQYDKGVITRSELCTRVFEHLTEENVGPLLETCPNEVLEFLIKDESEWPANDDPRWGRRLIFAVVCWVPGTTPEEADRYFLEQQDRVREGVRLFRAYRQCGTHATRPGLA